MTREGYHRVLPAAGEMIDKLFDSFEPKVRQTHGYLALGEAVQVEEVHLEAYSEVADGLPQQLSLPVHGGWPKRLMPVPEFEL